VNVQDLNSGVVISIGRPVGMHGLGYIANQVVRGALRHGYLNTLIADGYVGDEVPDRCLHLVENADKRLAPRSLSGRVTERLTVRRALIDALYDRYASQVIPACNVFHGFAAMSLSSIKAAAKNGARTVLDNPNSHPMFLYDLMKEEFELCGQRMPITDKWQARRAAAEIELADKIPVLSTFAQRTFLDRGIPKDKLVFNPYGVDTETFRPGLKLDDVFRVVFCGQISLRKGVHYLLDAWESIPYVNSELLMVGLVTYEGIPIMQKAAALSRVKHIQHTESQAHLSSLYKSGSVFVCPSVEDGFAMVVTEAMACGLPVIVTENTGARDLVKNGENGFIVKIRDATAIKDRLLWFYHHPKECKQMGECARETVINCHWSDYQDRLASTYEALSATR